MKTRTMFIVAAALLVLVAFVVAGCATPTPQVIEKEVEVVVTATPAPTAVPPEIERAPGVPERCKNGIGGTCRVAFVDSFAANDTNLGWQKYARIAAGKEPLKSEWDFSQHMTDFSAEAQNAVLENLLADGVDALVFNSVGDHSADEIIAKACEQDVVVVTFNITSKAGLCEYRVEVAWETGWSYYAGTWLAKKLGCEGNVIVDLGISGLGVSQEILNGQWTAIKDVCGENHGIKVVGEYYGEYSEAKSGADVAALLATISEPIDAIMGNQGYCVIVAEAFEAAGRPVPILNCQGFNQAMEYCGTNDVECWINAGTGAPIIGAMDAAYRILNGEDVPKLILNDAIWFTTDTSIDAGTPKPLRELKVGDFWYPGLSPVFFVNWTWEGAVGELTFEEATGMTLEEAIGQ